MNLRLLKPNFRRSFIKGEKREPLSASAIDLRDISTLKTSKNKDIKLSILAYTENPLVILEALNSRDWHVRLAAITHVRADLRHIEIAIKDKSDIVRRATFKSPHITIEHISFGLSDSQWEVRHAAISHPKATKEHISRAIRDVNEFVRRAAVKHPNATVDHILIAVRDNSFCVRNAARSIAQEKLNKHFRGKSGQNHRY
jgi:hypothetical protein